MIKDGDIYIQDQLGASRYGYISSKTTIEIFVIFFKDKQKYCDLHK